MIIFGKPLSEYIAFAKLFLVLILVTGVIRLVLSLNGTPNSTAQWFTMTGLAWIGLIYYAIRVHTSGFGSYKQLLVICVLQDWIAQAIAVTGIAIAMVTGKDNVFSSPEFFFGNDGKTWLHLGAHLVVGTTVGALFPWAIGCAILALTKKLTGSYSSSTSMERS